MNRRSPSPCCCSQATLKDLKSKCALSPLYLQGTSFNNHRINPGKPWCLICQRSPACSTMLVLEQESTLQSTKGKMGAARAGSEVLWAQWPGKD